MLKIGNKGVSPVVGTILLIAITVALAAVVATLVSGLGGRGAPPNALLAVSAKENGENAYHLTISHEGGDDLAVKDLQIQATTPSTASGYTVYDFAALTGASGTFSVGMLVSTGTGTPTAIPYTNVTGQVVSIYIIHKPSKQKIFSSPTVAVSKT